MIEIIQYLSIDRIIIKIKITIIIPIKLRDPYWYMKFLPKCFNSCFYQIEINDVLTYKWTDYLCILTPYCSVDSSAQRVKVRMLKWEKFWLWWACSHQYIILFVFCILSVCLIKSNCSFDIFFFAWTSVTAAILNDDSKLICYDKGHKVRRDFIDK